MESNMVNDSPLDPLECISLVETFFQNNFKKYNLLKKTNYTGYWWIEYSDTVDTKICFDGDIGGHFSIIIFIDNAEYSLWQFDRSVNNATKSTNGNILYQLDVLKRFLNESPI